MQMPVVEHYAVPRPLRRHFGRRFADLLGGGPLAYKTIEDIVFIAACYRASLQVSKGHSQARTAAGLLRAEGCLRRGDDSPEAVALITDPMFGVSDVETHERLSGLLSDPTVPSSQKADAVRERQLEVENLPHIDARYGAVVVLAASALIVWQNHSAVRDDRRAQWNFILEALKAAGANADHFRCHPERLKADLAGLMAATSLPLP
jgi:hypothetical protein